MSINIKTLYIDADGAKTMVTPGSTSSANIVLYRGTEYVLRANVYANATTSANSVSFANTTGFELDIGRVYESNAAPVIIENNTASWNNVADWSLVDPSDGLISVRVNTTGTGVSADLGNASSQQYTMEIWYQGNLASRVLVASDSCFIHNSTIL